ncbi:MAG: hypothetical protein ACOC3Z_00645 [Nanoarchaeota archaeon]
MNFITKIFKGKTDEKVHLQFQKFSKGEFKNKAIIEAKNSNGKYTIKTSPEFANELVRIIAEKIKNKKTKVTGAVISTFDLEGKIDYKEKKQFQGVKRYIIDNEMTGKEIIDLLEEFPKIFFALSFESQEDKLKIKPKAPKSGKPGSKGEEVKADFCSLKTQDKDIAKDFVFEKEDFKKARIKHTFIIEDIIISEELKKQEDFKKMREEAIRKGKIIRESEIDNENIKNQEEFEA